MAIHYRNGVSILLLIFYLPVLAIAILLAARHGFQRSSGWRFMIIFALARILCTCFDLATIAEPDNTSLYIGYTILIGIAISPLELVAFGLLSRITSNINKFHPTIITPRQLRWAMLLTTAGIIVAIIGGVDSNYSSTGQYSPQILSKLGLALFLASFVIILAVTIILSFSVSHAEPGEKRILLAVACSLPLLLVRFMYSVMFTFKDEQAFSSLVGSVTSLLCMALLEEIGVVLIYEGTGLTLRKVRKGDCSTQSENAKNDVEAHSQELGST